MSRIAKIPVTLPKGVEVTITEGAIRVKGPKGQMERKIHPFVTLSKEEDGVKVNFDTTSYDARMHAGTARNLIKNMVKGVSDGFERRLALVGVGYRVQVSGKKVNLSLGFSHPVVYDLPEGVTAESPSQTELVLKGMDNQKLGQVASELRGYRPPEAYKGKGIRYFDEKVQLKEAKKK
ncbi:MAG: 50S ribosomal protein L6 [Gammaproteobacteria bacterium]|nr:50S ribosomal protein L6 [Gammaproteobacteria bacterium]